MSQSLTIQDDQDGFTPQQVAALHQIGVEDATPGDLAVFFHQVQRTGLDPFARQIYMIGRRQKQGNQWVTKQTIQTGIDGFRLIARRACDRTKETLSISQPYYATPDGKWLDFWPFDTPPVAAKVMVKRGGGEFPAVAMFREYAGTTRDGSLTRMWADKPSVMIGKCAEALALRKAFPLDLSGLYTAEEMNASDSDVLGVEAPSVDRQPHVPGGASNAVAQHRATQPASTEVVEEIRAHAAELHLSRDTLEKTLRYVTQNADGVSLDDLTAEAGDALVTYLRQRVEQARADAANEPVEEVLEGIIEDGDA